MIALNMSSYPLITNSYFTESEMMKSNILNWLVGKWVNTWLSDIGLTDWWTPKCTDGQWAVHCSTYPRSINRPSMNQTHVVGPCWATCLISALRPTFWPCLMTAKSKWGTWRYMGGKWWYLCTDHICTVSSSLAMTSRKMMLTVSHQYSASVQDDRWCLMV